MSQSSLNNRDNIPKTVWEVCKYYMILNLVEKLLLNAALMMLTAPNIISAEFCIPDFQRQAFEMCWFESAHFQMPPSAIG
jgi:hypothetical protein